MIGCLIALAIVLALLWMKTGVSIKWGTLEAAIRVRIGFLRFTVWPEGKPKKDAPAKETASAVSVSALERQERSVLKKWLVALWEKRRELLELLGKTMEYPTLDRLCLHVMVGNPDPAACALEYGAVCAAIGTGLSVLYRTFQVKKQDISVNCRYDLPKTHTEGEVELSIRAYLLIYLGITALRHFLKVYQSTKMTEKAVQSL